MTLRRLFIQAAWTTFKGLRPNASSENAREHLIGDLATSYGMAAKTSASVDTGLKIISNAWAAAGLG